MRIKALFFFSFLFWYGILFSQEKSLPGNKLYFKLFQEFRITPIDIGNDFSSIPYVPVFFSRDDHLAGLSYGGGLSYFIQKNRIAFSVSNSVRYDHVYFNMEPQHRILENVKRFMADVHFDVSKYISVKKNHIQFGFGFSWMNIGSEYSRADFFHLPNGDTSYLVSTGDLRFNTVNFSMGYQTGRLSLEIINRFTLHHQFSSKGNLILPTIRIGYSFGLKNENIIQR